MQAGATVKVDVLASIKDVKAADPEGDCGAKNEHAQIEVPSNGNPRGSWSTAESKAKEKMRPVGEALGVGVEGDDKERKRREFERERVELPGGDDENGYCGEREEPCKGDREGTGGECALRCPRVFF